MQIVEKILKIPKTKDGSVTSDNNGVIEITDSYKHKLKGVEIGGNTFQQTYTGINLLNWTLPVNVSAEGNIRITNIPQLEVGANYYFYGKCSDGTILGGGNATFVWFNTNTSTTIKNAPPRTTFTGVDVSNANYFYVYVSSALVGKTIKECMLVKGTYDSSNIPAYQPYVGGIPSPNPDYPQEVQNVSGTINVKVANGSDSTASGYEEQTATLTLPNGMELCKIGNYQDSIIKQNGKWYKNKKINKVVLNGSESWSTIETTTDYAYFYSTKLDSSALSNETKLSYCDKFNWVNDIGKNLNINNNNYAITVANYNKLRIAIQKTLLSTVNVAGFKSWLLNNNTTIYYALKTPVLEEITDTTLISQLDNLSKMSTYQGTSIITISSDITPTITIDYYKNKPIHKYITNKAYYDYMQDIVY